MMMRGCVIWIVLNNGFKEENIMKKILVAMFVAVTVASQSSAGLFDNDDSMARERAETAIVLLNHLNWVVSRVEQNKDNSDIRF